MRGQCIKMKLGMEVGLGPGHNMLWGPSLDISCTFHYVPRTAIVKSNTVPIVWLMGTQLPQDVEELGPHLTQFACAEAYLSTKWHLESWSIQPFGHKRRGPKIGVCPFGESRSPIVLDGDQTPPKGHSPNFRPQLWPNGRPSQRLRICDTGTWRVTNWIIIIIIIITYFVVIVSCLILL